jgi:hypothetical protein
MVWMKITESGLRRNLGYSAWFKDREGVLEEDEKGFLISGDERTIRRLRSGDQIDVPANYPEDEGGWYRRSYTVSLLGKPKRREPKPIITEAGIRNSTGKQMHHYRGSPPIHGYGELWEAEDGTFYLSHGINPFYRRIRDGDGVGIPDARGNLRFQEVRL